MLLRSLYGGRSCLNGDPFITAAPDSQTSSIRLCRTASQLAIGLQRFTFIPNSAVIRRCLDYQGQYRLLAGCHAGLTPHWKADIYVEVTPATRIITIGNGVGMHTPRYG
jgi:hypothetical protein